MHTLLIPLLLILALHQTWFHSHLPAHVFGLLKELGLNLPWSKEGYETQDLESWNTWAILELYSKHPFLSQFLTCPTCLSWHISTWVSVLFLLLGHFTMEQAFVTLFGGVVGCRWFEIKHVM